jgi:hypothetical protein
MLENYGVAIPGVEDEPQSRKVWENRAAISRSKMGTTPITGITQETWDKTFEKNAEFADAQAAKAEEE